MPKHQARRQRAEDAREPQLGATVEDGLDLMQYREYTKEWDQDHAEELDLMQYREYTKEWDA